MPARLSAADRTGRTVRCGRPRCPQDLVAGPRGQRAVPQEPSPALHTTCNPKSVYVCTRQCLPYEVRNHGVDSNAPLLRQYCAPGPAKCPAWSSAWWRMLDGRRRSACCQQNGALPGLILQHTYQIQVFTGLAEEEALHPVLFGFVDDMMQRSVATPTEQSPSEAHLCSFPPAH